MQFLIRCANKTIFYSFISFFNSFHHLFSLQWDVKMKCIWRIWIFALFWPVQDIGTQQRQHKQDCQMRVHSAFMHNAFAMQKCYCLYLAINIRNSFATKSYEPSLKRKRGIFERALSMSCARYLILISPISFIHFKFIILIIYLTFVLSWIRYVPLRAFQYFNASFISPNFN